MADEKGTQVKKQDSILLTTAVATCMGIWFGFMFEKSRVFEPASIRGQFLLTRWIMLKMFFG